jgi:hypothetical protein
LKFAVSAKQKQRSAGSLSKSSKQVVFSCLKTDGSFYYGSIKTIRQMVGNKEKSKALPSRKILTN